MKYFIFVLLILFFVSSCNNKLNTEISLNYCLKKIDLSLDSLNAFNQFPRSIDNKNKQWSCVSFLDWTSGFWPGILWFDYEVTHNNDIKLKADNFTLSLKPLAFRHVEDHDLGFMIFCSFGNGYRLTHNPEYKRILLAAADSLATLYNPKVGTILSWPRMVKRNNWPHNTIIDNMMNLELLFWAAKNSNSRKLYDIAISHADITMKNHFRSDYSAYHVVVYDTLSGKKIKGVTHQGLSDNSMWARGQAWAIYGYTLCYRETKNPEYLFFTHKITNAYLDRLPDDYVPFWDFDDPAIPHAPKDASAAAITASALIELSILTPDKELSKKYLNVAQKTLISLSSNYYLSGNRNQAFLLHSVGNMPVKGEVDASIIYADYYYLEALVRLKKIQEGKSIYENL